MGGFSCSGDRSDGLGRQHYCSSRQSSCSIENPTVLLYFSSPSPDLKSGTLERAAPTAADPEEKSPSGCVGGCFGDGSPSRIGEPESWSEGFFPIVSYGTLPRASEFTIRSQFRTLGGHLIKIDSGLPNGSEVDFRIV